MNRVYQHGSELFVTFDATPRLRNLRTGLTITPRVPFKYLGEMPQVGQVWLWESRGRTKRIVEVDGTTVHVIAQNGEKGTIPLVGLLRDHTLRNFHFATGDKEPLNPEATDRRFTVAESLRDYQTDAIFGTATHEQMIRNMDAVKQCCMADVEAEAKVRVYVGLYMAPDGQVVRVQGAANGRVGITTEGYFKDPRFISEDTFNATYSPLPLPGQLWAKGSRYVTVDRVEDGRVYYTDGSSGLRRFLNEYAHMSELVDYRHIKPSEFGMPTGAGKTRSMSQMIGRSVRTAHQASIDALESGANAPIPPRPFITAKSARGKLRELALGYRFGKQGLKDFGAQVQRHGRMLRPTPTGKPDPVEMSVLSNRPIGTVASCTMTEKGLHIMLKINDNDAERVRLNVQKAQLKQELRTVARRLKELSKPPAEPLSFSDLTFQRGSEARPRPERDRFKECAEVALRGFYFDLKAVRTEGDTRMEFRSKEEFIEFCCAVASL